MIATWVELKNALSRDASIGVIHFNLKDDAAQELKVAKKRAAKVRAKKAHAEKTRAAAARAPEAAADDEETETDAEAEPEADAVPAPEPESRQRPMRQMHRQAQAPPKSRPKRDNQRGRDTPVDVRWQVLRAWLLHLVLHRRGQTGEARHMSRVPKAIALYLFYDEDNASRIVWPVRNGVCGCTSRAPRSDGASGADWGAAAGISTIVNAAKRGEHALEPDSLVSDREVFGPMYGPDAQTPMAGF